MKPSRRSLLKALAALPLLNACAAQRAQPPVHTMTLAAGVHRQRLICHVLAHQAGGMTSMFRVA